MRAALLVVVVLAGGCHKEAGPPAPSGPVSTTDVDALWKLAPAGAMFGVVASPHALEMLEHTWGDLDAFAHAAPDFKDYAAKMDEQLQKAIGSTKPSFAALGLSTKKGAAMFIGADKKPVFILPVGDRDLFVKLVHGTKGDKTDKLDDKTTCQTMNGNYVCVEDIASFDTLGKGQLTASAAGARGDIESAGKDLPAGRGMPISFGAVIQMSRGAFTVRGGVTGVPKLALTAMGEASKPRIDSGKTTGFALAHIKALVAALPMPAKAQMMFATIADPITAITYSNHVDAQVPLTDAGPAKLIVEGCDKGPLGSLGAKIVDGACQFQLPNVPGFNLDLWLDGNTLHAGKKSAAAGASVELSGMGKEMAETAWQDAVYGRGSILALDSDVAAQMQQMGAQMPPSMPEMLDMVMRASLMMNELGLGARVDGDTLRFMFSWRTAFSNPDDVVAKLATLDIKQLYSGKGPELAKAIATKGSPLESDVAAGWTGVMIQSAGVGVIAAVSIPAFMDYMKKSKRTEASLQLNKIGKNAKRIYAEEGAFPIGKSTQLPAGTCCGQPTNKCAADPAAFAKDPIWTKLEFEIDEPALYQYSYESTDGKSATVTATGDADCDGVPAIYKLQISTANGGPTMDIIPPAAGTY